MKLRLKRPQVVVGGEFLMGGRSGDVWLFCAVASFLFRGSCQVLPTSDGGDGGVVEVKKEPEEEEEGG
jgi:hypothetical protein